MLSVLRTVYEGLPWWRGAGGHGFIKKNEERSHSEAQRGHPS